MILQKLGTVLITVISAVILYYLTIGVIIDAIDDAIEASVALHTPGLSIISAILGVYTLVIMLVIIASSRFISRDLEVAGPSMAIGWILVVLVMCTGIVMHPDVPFTIDAWVSMPAIYVAFVTGDPATYLVMYVVAFASIYAINSALEVQ